MQLWVNFNTQKCGDGLNYFSHLPKNIFSQFPVPGLVRVVMDIRRIVKMKKSHIAVIVFSVSIAFLALFVGNAAPGTGPENNAYTAESE